MIIDCYQSGAARHTSHTNIPVQQIVEASSRKRPVQREPDLTLEQSALSTGKVDPIVQCLCYGQHTDQLAGTSHVHV